MANFISLKKRQRTEQYSYSDNLSLGLHLALSWLQTAEICENHSDDNKSLAITVWQEFSDAARSLLDKQYGLPSFFLMHNLIQNYPWGSRTSIQELFAIPNPSNEAQAEIWMGAHKNACSYIFVNEKKVSLADFIEQDRELILNTATAHKFAELPFLFKVLAAEKALSIQVHPSKLQAEQGFKKEQQAAIELSSAHRNYKDPNQKPELLYALTPFHALNGFREFSEIIYLFKKLALPALHQLVCDFAASPNESGLRIFFYEIHSLRGEHKTKALQDLLDYAQRRKNCTLFSLILDLAQQYPNDIGLFSPLMLNVLTLQPGEAMYVDACTAHAYIKGTGLEMMANSDNVLRAGLTNKHIDLEEFVACTRFVSKTSDSLILTPEKQGNCLCYPIPVDDFKFSLFANACKLQLNTESAEIIMAIDSDLTFTHKNGSVLTISKGQSAFIPANTGEFIIESKGRVARAFN